MTKEEVIDIIIPLRRTYSPKLDRFFGHEAEDILASVAASCLAQAHSFHAIKHVQAFFAKSVSGRIKSEFRRRARTAKLINEYVPIYRMPQLTLYDLRQALKIAFTALTNTMQLAVWKIYALEEKQGVVAKKLNMTRAKLKSRLVTALTTLREHPALGPWKPKKR